MRVSNLVPSYFVVGVSFASLSRDINFASFRTAAIEKVSSGLTTVQEILRVVPRTALYNNSLNQERTIAVQLTG